MVYIMEKKHGLVSNKRNNNVFFWIGRNKQVDCDIEDSL